MIKVDPNWLQRIAQAKEVGHFTEEDKIDVSSFDTCPCAELQPEKTIELPIGLPAPRTHLYLDELGMHMFTAVLGDNIARVELIYDLIKSYPRASRALLSTAHITVPSLAEDLLLTDEAD